MMMAVKRALQGRSDILNTIFAKMVVRAANVADNAARRPAIKGRHCIRVPFVIMGSSLWCIRVRSFRCNERLNLNFILP